MDFTARSQRLNIPVAPLVAALVGGVTALAFTLMPVGILEDFVLDSGIASVMPAAEPPLGNTARAMLILAGGGGIALITWFTLFLVLGARAIVIQRQVEMEGEEPPLVLRRADAHPDAPARRPLFANRDLGTPFLEVHADRPVHVAADLPEDADHATVDRAPAPFIFKREPTPRPVIVRDIPADLDMPLAAFDPEAIPASPAGATSSAESADSALRAAWISKSAPPADSPRPILGSLEPDSPRPIVAPLEPESPRPIVGAVEPESPRPIVAPLHIDSPPAAPVTDAGSEARSRWFPKRPSPVSPSRQQVFDAGERFETFPLTPPVRNPAPAPAPQGQGIPEAAAPLASIRPSVSARVEDDPSASIHALLDRLERVVGQREAVARRAPPPAAREDSLEETLGTLRRLATGG